MMSDNGDTPCAGEVEGARALTAFVQVIEAIEGARLEVWEQTGLTLQQARVLHIIEHELDFPVQSELAKRLGVRPATVTLQLNRLMRLGLVERIRDHSDRRIRHVALTECGRRVLDAMFHPTPGALARAIANYPRENVEAALAMLEQLSSWIAQQPATPASVRERASA
jgi:DNA-binding MarR family transcriptional regulator